MLQLHSPEEQSSLRAVLSGRNPATVEIYNTLSKMGDSEILHNNSCRISSINTPSWSIFFILFPSFSSYSTARGHKITPEKRASVKGCFIRCKSFGFGGFLSGLGRILKLEVGETGTKGIKDVPLKYVGCRLLEEKNTCISWEG